MKNKIHFTIEGDTRKIEDFLDQNKVKFTKRLKIRSPQGETLGLIISDTVFTILRDLSPVIIGLLLCWLSEQKDKERYTELIKKLESIEKNIKKK